MGLEFSPYRDGLAGEINSMTKRMLVDATHPEETRVAIVDSYRDNNRLIDFDFGLASKPLLKGNIYLAKVMRVEPSLQAAFVEYGGNRHGFLSFSEIHPDYFRIPVADRPAEADEPIEAIEAAGEQEIPEPPEVDAFDREDLAPIEEAALPTIVAEEAFEQPIVEQPIVPMAPSPFADHDGDVGLITDFGNAVVIDPVIPTEGEAPVEQPITVESVGGDSERVVRRPHRPHYKIQEVLKRGQVMLIQVVKEERGNKGAALTTFLSLAGRYCVLMPNTDHGGGVSRKITNHQDRRRMKEVLDQLEIPEGMAVILRTAGMEQEPPEIQRDLEYLLRLWDSIREQTLQSNAPNLIYEEANLIKRSVRDLYSQDIDEILVAGDQGYERARDFMRTIMPDEVEKIKLYQDNIPLFFRYNVENQIDSLHNPVVQLRSGGYIVINPTEALVAIDVNSGRATRERHIEETALKTNLEAADEVARQLRLRDLAGLIVVDFIDMEDGRNNYAVERRLKEAMKNDRARLQIGRISPFGLMELSRQRLRPSLTEINFEKCPHCAGLGLVRSIDSAALSILRVIEEEGIKQRTSEITLRVHTRVALYLLNQKRAAMSQLEKRYDLHVLLQNDDSLIPPEYKMERSRNKQGGRQSGPAVDTDQVFASAELELPPIPQASGDIEGDVAQPEPQESENYGNGNQNRGRRRFRDRNFGRRNRDRQNSPDQQAFQHGDAQPTLSDPNTPVSVDENGDPNFNAAPENQQFRDDNEGQQRRRRRGRRGGRRRGNGNENHNGGNRWENRNRNNNQRQGHPQAEAPVSVPTSIHEIDTTPRDVSFEPRPAPAQQRSYEPRPEKRERTPSPNEVVNPPVDQPKGGWWRRFTGQ